MAIKKKWEDELNANYNANNRALELAVNKAQSGDTKWNSTLDKNLADMNARIQDAQKRMASQQGVNTNLATRAQQNPAQTPQGANTNPMTSEDVMNQWMNRQPFQYDMNADAMYQQYKDQYMRQGRLAMQDTIGRASALTGGYGNSYATAAGQQQYNEHLAGLNDKALELSDRAYQRWQDEGDRLKDAYGMLYGRERDAVADEQWNKQFDEGVRQFDLTRADQREQFALQYDLDVKKFEEDCRRYGLDYALAQAKQAHQEKMDQQEMDYKYAALAQDDAQFYANLGRQSAADARDYELALMKLGDGTGSGLGGNPPQGVVPKPSQTGPDTLSPRSIDFNKLGGYKDLDEMTAKLPVKLAASATSSDDYLGKVSDQLAKWEEKGYIDEDQANALWYELTADTKLLESLDLRGRTKSSSASTKGKTNTRTLF